MKKMLFRNTLRSVKNTKSRFIAIMAIIAIGSGFFAGVKSAGPDMKLSAADYLDKQALDDFHIVSESAHNNTTEGGGSPDLFLKQIQLFSDGFFFDYCDSIFDFLPYTIILCCLKRFYNIFGVFLDFSRFLWYNGHT